MDQRMGVAVERERSGEWKGPCGVKGEDQVSSWYNLNGG